MLASAAALLGGGAFIAIGAGALFAPQRSSVPYGLPTTDPAALAYVRAVGARDVVLGIILVRLVAMHERSALELVLAASVIAAAGDAVAVVTGRTDAGPAHIAVHALGAAALVTAWALVRRER